MTRIPEAQKTFGVNQRLLKKVVAILRISPTNPDQHKIKYMNMNNDKQSQMTICTVTNDGKSATYFSEKQVALNGNEERQLSDQISALNFRLRTSDAPYASDWHVAGDPTLLIILKGIIEIELRNGTKKQFKAGEMFIAEDFLQTGIIFSDKHGHSAKIIGEESIQALHLKLNKR